DEAYSMGLVSELAEDDEAIDRALDLAGKIAALPPLSAEAIKEVIVNGEDLPLAQALMLERRTFQLLFAAQDRTEGMTAFIERRQPNFTGS
ncbi:MAG TPA: enoyl-CoA hydratase-related protein, partial [Rhabdaerophilum sp.]|nr:enoyl-CoA hydratase-related protein [Rhabdaerophilum sp.]